MPVCFADDLLLVSGAAEKSVRHSIVVAVERLQPAANILLGWCSRVGIEIGLQKTEVRYIGAPTIAQEDAPQASIKLGENEIAASHGPFSFLGLRFSAIGSLIPHANYVCEKLHAAALAIKEAFLPPCSKRILADGLGLSHLRYASGVFLPWLLAEGNKGSYENVCAALSVLARAVCGVLPSAHRDAVLREAGFESIPSIAFKGAARVVQAALPQHHPLHAYLGNTVPASAFSLVSSVVRLSWLREHPLDPLRQVSRFQLVRPPNSEAWPIIWWSPPGHLSKNNPTNEQLDANEERYATAKTLVTQRWPTLRLRTIATDGSVADRKSRAVAVSEGVTLAAIDCGPLACSYRAEAVALLATLDALNSQPPAASVLVTDSQGLLAALSRGPFAARGRIEVQIWASLLRLSAVGHRFLLAFVFSHCDFGPNEEADAAAKALLATSPPLYPNTWHTDMARHLLTAFLKGDPPPAVLSMKQLRSVPLLHQRLFHQVRTGWVKDIGRCHASADEVPCPTCGEPQTVEHYLQCTLQPPLAMTAFFEPAEWKDACSRLWGSLHAS